MSFGWIDDRSMIQPSRNSTISNCSSSRRSRYYLSDSVDENYNERPTRKKQYDTWTSGYGFDEEEEDEDDEEERLHQQQQQQSQQNCRRNQRKRNGKHNSISSLPILPSASLRSILKSSSSTENLICSDYLDKRNRIEDTFDAVPPGVKAYWMREQQLRKSLKQGKKVQFHENSEANKRRKQQYTREGNDMSSDDLESELESIFFRGDDEVYRDKRPATPVSRKKINKAGKTPSKDQQNFPKGSKALHNNNNNNNNNNHNNNMTTNHNNNNNNNHNNNKNHRSDVPPQINDTGYMEQDSSNQVNCPFKRSYTKMGVDPNEDVVQFNALRRKSIHHINSFARSSARSSQQSNFGYRMSQRMRGPIADPRASLRDFSHPSVSNHVHMQQLRKQNNRDCDPYREQQRTFSVRSSSRRSSKRHNNRGSYNMGNNANQNYLPKSQSQYMEELEYESSNEPANSPFQRSYSTREYGMRQNGRRNHHHHQHHHRSSVRQGNHNHQNRMAGLPNNGAISHRQGELSDSGVMKNSMRRKSVFNSLQNSVPGDQQTLATESSYIGSVNSINTLDSNGRNNMNNNNNNTNNNNNSNINSNGFSDCSRENEYDTVEECDNNVSSTDNREPRAMEDSFGPLPRPIMPVMEENNDDLEDEIQPNVEERKGWSYLAGSLAQEAVAVALRRSARRSTKYLSDKSEVEGSVKSVSIKSERQTKRQKPVPARIGIPSQIVPVPKKEIQQASNTQSSSYPSSNTNVYQTPKQESYNSISFQGTTQNPEGMDYIQKPNISKGVKFQPDSSPSLIPLQSLAAMIPPVEESGILPQFPSMNCNYNLPLGVVRPQPVILAPLPLPPNILPKPVKKPEMNIEDESAGDIILAPVVSEGPKTEEPKKEKAKKQANSSKTAECEEMKNDENNVKKEGKKKKKKKRKKKKKGKKNNEENVVQEDKEKTEKKKEEVKEKEKEKVTEKVNKKEKEKNKKNVKKQSPSSKKDAKTESKLDIGDSDGTDAFQTPPSSLKDSKSSGGSGGNKTNKPEGKQGKTKAKSNTKHSKDKKDLEKKTGNSKAEQQQGKNSCDIGQSGDGQENKTEEARGQGLSRLTRKISHRVGSWGKEIKRLLSIKVEQPPPSPPKRSTEGNNSVSSEENSKNGNNNKHKSKNTKKLPPVHKKSLSDISSAQENQDEFSKAGNSSCDVNDNDDDDDNDNDNDVDVDDDVLNFCDEGKTTQIMNWLHEMYSTHSSDSRVSPVMAATTVATQF